MEFHTLPIPSLPPHPIQITISSTPSIPSNPHNHQFFSIIIQSISSILTRFHAGYFRITLSLASQALLWKNLIQPTNNNTINPLIHHIFHRFHPITFVSFWAFSLVILVLLSFIYVLRCVFHLKMVKEEFLHHVGVNYLFAPWISWLLLLQCSPWIDHKTEAHLSLWWALVLPVLLLDVKIYGQWFTTKGLKYNLTAVANPTSQMSVIGNLIGSTAAARMGWNETALMLFSLGMVHYLVLFVTLYQRLSGSDKLPAMLKPVFFLFFAAPGAASLAWGSISGKFDITAKMLFFLSIFLFMSLVCRPLLFKKAMRRFNVTWWAYPFSITVLALAATEYAEEVKERLANVLMLILVSSSILVTFILILLTLFNSTMLLPHNDPIFTITTTNTAAVSPHPDHSLPSTALPSESK
ncbi:unnamed protein product [Amaranthus hypochondriacus]